MTGFLLDTNVISELTRPAPEPRVAAWMARQVLLDLYLSAVTLGELVRGVTRLPNGRRRETLRRWVEEDLAKQFVGRVLPFDQATAVVWGQLMGEGDRAGRPRPADDTKIAATALRFDLTLATRNVADFAGMTPRLVNPWQAA